MERLEFDNIFLNRLRSIWGEKHYRDLDKSEDFYRELHDACHGFKDTTLRNSIVVLRDKFKRWPSISEISHLCGYTPFHPKDVIEVIRTPEPETPCATLEELKEVCRQKGWPENYAVLAKGGKVGDILAEQWQRPLNQRAGLGLMEDQLRKNA